LSEHFFRSTGSSSPQKDLLGEAGLGLSAACAECSEESFTKELKMPEQLIIAELEAPISILTFNRPEAMNALSTELLGQLDAVLDQLARSSDVRVIILTGAGKAFVAGADIAEMSQFDPLQARRFAALGQRLMHRLEGMSKVTIAAVNGYALGGGCEIAMSCDIVLASEKALFGQPEVSLGVTPGFGGTQRLPRLVGIARAMELILTGELIKANDAAAIGLVNHVYPPEELLPKAKEMAAKIASHGWEAVKASKRCIRQGMQTDLATGCALEAEAFAVLFATEDQKVRMRNFVEKKK